MCCNVEKQHVKSLLLLLLLLLLFFFFLFDVTVFSILITMVEVRPFC